MQFETVMFAKLKNLTRRQFLKNTSMLAAGAALTVKAPFVHAKTRPTLRVLGTHVTLQEELRLRAQQELDINRAMV